MCLDMKSNCIDVSWLVLVVDDCIVVNLNDSQRNNTSFISLKSNTEQCYNSTSYQTIYHCIVIHQRQYIDTSTHCIVATLVLMYDSYSTVMQLISSVWKIKYVELLWSSHAKYNNIKVWAYLSKLFTYLYFFWEQRGSVYFYRTVTSNTLQIAESQLYCNSDKLYTSPPSLWCVNTNW